MGKGPDLHSKEKAIIVNVRSYFDQEKKSGGPTPDDIRNPLKRTAAAVGYSDSTVKRTCKEKRDSGNLTSPMKKGKSGRSQVVFDEFLQGVIRRTVMDFYIRREYPTVDKLLSHLKKHVDGFPDISSRTFLRRLRKMGYRHKKFSKKPILMESADTAAKRNLYLRNVRRLRQQGWTIFYTDETWCGANHSKKFGWQEQVVSEDINNYNSYRNVPQVNGWRGGILTPSGAGQRVIILHIGSENGFLYGGEKCFIGKKGSADYYQEMNKQHYEEWFRHILTLLPNKSAIVIDQAPYHTMMTEESKNPNMGWRKDAIIDWIERHQIQLPEDAEEWSEFTKPSLLQTAKPHFQPKEYLLEKIVGQCQKQIKILWLPVAHCELNPIELIWAYIKNAVARENKTFKIKDVLQLCQSKLSTVPQSVWANSVRHAQKVEQYYWDKDRLCDTAVEEFVVSVGNDDSSSSEESSSSESEDCSSSSSDTEV